MDQGRLCHMLPGILGNGSRVLLACNAGVSRTQSIQADAVKAKIPHFRTEFILKLSVLLKRRRVGGGGGRPTLPTGMFCAEHTKTTRAAGCWI